MLPKKRTTRSTEPAQSFKNKGGHSQDPVWIHFNQTPLSTAGHFAAECRYCGNK